MNILIQVFAPVSLCTFVYFYVTSNVFRYHIKYLLLALSMTTCATVFIPLMLWRPRSYKNALLPALTLKYAGRFLGIRCTVQGHENIVKDSGCVVLINHQSIVDLLVLAEIWPLFKNATVIAKKEIFYMWPFGLATWLWGTIFIDRLNGEQAKNTINTTANTIREKQAKLCMFPEGTRHGGEELLTFKKGAFHVAISSQCPVQPIIVSQYYFLDSKKRIFGDGIVNIRILSPISTASVKKENVDSLISMTYDIMNKEYKKLTHETLEQVKEKTE